jgi:glutamyl-tRNA reductase
VLSTCNRTEIYTWAGNLGAATDQILLFLEGLKELPPGWAKGRARVMHSDEAIRHVFAVTAGLDSMVVGESEIQGQVRAAYRTAAALGAVGPHLHGLFRWALECGKHARTASGLRRSHESFPRAAGRAIEATTGHLDGAEVLIVGNGAMAQATMRALARSGARLGVAARRVEAAEELAGEHDGFALPLHALPDALITADAAVFATSAPEPLIGAEELEAVLRQRRGRPLAVVDLGLPRNVDAAAARLQGFRLFDLGRLDAEGFTTAIGHVEQLTAATEVVMTEADRCVSWFRARPADAVVAAIQARAARLAESEAETAVHRIAGLDERQRAAVEQAIRRTVRRVVHVPTVRTKEACARGDEHLVEAARWLFALDEEEAAEPVASEVDG